MMVNEESLLAFFRSELGHDTTGVERETLLYSSGRLDSFSLVLLIQFLEDNASIRVEPVDVSLDNFDSLERILAYVSKARGGD